MVVLSNGFKGRVMAIKGRGSNQGKNLSNHKPGAKLYFYSVIHLGLTGKGEVPGPGSPCLFMGDLIRTGTAFWLCRGLSRFPLFNAGGYFGGWQHVESGLGIVVHPAVNYSMPLRVGEEQCFSGLATPLQFMDVILEIS